MEAGQDVFGHHVVHHVPLVRDLERVVEPGHVLQAQEAAAAQVPQPGRAQALADGPNLVITADDQGVRTLPDELGEPFARSATWGQQDPGSPRQVGASFAQPPEVSTLPEHRCDGVLRQDDPTARVERGSLLTSDRDERDERG